MALTAAEEALVRELIAQNPELLSLAGNEATIISKLGATKKNLSQLAAALSLNDADLAFVRQGTSDKSVALSVLKAFVAAGVDLSTYLPKSGGTMTGLLKFAAGASIASAATVNLSTATGNTVHITGTTGISAWTMTAGQFMQVIFDGALILTHNTTTNNLQGAANITTAAGDRATVYYDGTTTYVFGYHRADGTALVSTGGKMLLVPAVATTSGTAINVTSIPSWAKNITVQLNGVSTNGTSNYQVQLGTSSGIVSNGYASTGDALTNASPVVTQNLTSGFLLISAAGSVLMSGALRLHLLGGTTWVADGKVKLGTTTTVGAAGDVTLAGALDSIRLTTVNGTDTFDAGSLSILIEGY